MRSKPPGSSRCNAYLYRFYSVSLFVHELRPAFNLECHRLKCPDPRLTAVAKPLTTKSGLVCQLLVPPGQVHTASVPVALRCSAAATSGIRRSAVECHACQTLCEPPHPCVPPSIADNDHSRRDVLNRPSGMTHMDPELPQLPSSALRAWPTAAPSSRPDARRVRDGAPRDVAIAGCGHDAAARCGKSVSTVFAQGGISHHDCSTKARRGGNWRRVSNDRHAGARHSFLRSDSATSRQRIATP